jgi:glycerophosphoryl diester phosphodiesterase
MRLLQLLFVTTIFFSLVGCTVTRLKSSSMHFASNTVIAHRGAFKKNGFPENSIASLREAIRLGCTGSEFDVRMTADEVLVVNHDPHHGGMDIESTSYAQLRSHRLSNGEEIPTLEAYLRAGLQDNKSTRLVLEIKPSPAGKARGQLLAQRVWEQVKKSEADAWVEYISFDYAILTKLIEMDSTVVSHYLNGEKSPADLQAAGIKGLDYNYKVYQQNPQWINEAKALGLILNVWTVNEPSQVEWCIRQGFDFITTNEPEYLLKLPAR